MASDLDTVRVLRALFNDMPRAPQGLSHEETMAWIQRSMTGFEGGETAYMIEHITRSSMLDIVLRLREDGHLKDDAAFEQTLTQLATPEGRKTFADWIIQAQRSVDATSRLLNRAKRSLSDPLPLFSPALEDIRRFVAGEASGPGPLYAEWAAREDVAGIGLAEEPAGRVHEFDWGFVVEEPAAWHFYLPPVWRKGTVGYFERFLQAWHLEVGTVPAGVLPAAAVVPGGLSVEPGIGSFSALTLIAAEHPVSPALRQWLGEVFIGQMLPHMAGRAADDDYDFPLGLPTGF